MTTSSPTIQFGCAATLFVLNEQNAYDLSNMRFTFKITANDEETPNTATIRIYNLAFSTIHKVIAEFTQVTLSAGYEGNEATIFITIDPSLFDPTQSVANSVLPMGGASARKAPVSFLGAP